MGSQLSDLTCLIQGDMKMITDPSCWAPITIPPQHCYEESTFFLPVGGFLPVSQGWSLTWDRLCCMNSSKQTRGTENAPTLQMGKLRPASEQIVAGPALGPKSLASSPYSHGTISPSNLLLSGCLLLSVWSSLPSKASWPADWQPFAIHCWRNRPSRCRETPSGGRSCHASPVQMLILPGL